MALITDSCCQDTAIFIAGLIIIAYFYVTRNFKYWQKRGVMELIPIPFVGSIAKCLFLRQSPTEFIKDLYNQFKGLPYVGFYLIDKPCLLICDREVVKTILIKDFNFFSDRYTGASQNNRLGCANLIFLKNPAWKFLRARLSPFFSSGKLKYMFNLMVECGDNLENYLESSGLEGNGKTIEIKELLTKFTTDIVNTTAFGINCISFKHSDAEFRKYGKIVQPTLKLTYERLVFFFFPSIARKLNIQFFDEETTAFIRKVFWKIFTARMKSNQKRNDFIDILVDLKKTYSDQDIPGFKFDGDDLLAQPLSFFSIGSETAATTTAFAMHQIALHPEIQNKLRNEILDALSKTGGTVTYDMICSLPYLDMVVSETLRIFPPVGVLSRTTTETYKVPNSNLILEKGLQIFISSIGMHCNTEYFPNPDKFDPERFTEENKRDRLAGVYYPFGDGPHYCIGKRFGLLQIKLAIFKILTKFEVTPCEKTLIPMVLDHRTLLTAPLNGVMYLNIRKINTK